MGKITVKHYLNTRVLPVKNMEDSNNNDYYPVYIQVTHNRKTTQIRSFIDALFTVNSFNNYENKKIFIDNEALADSDIIQQLDREIRLVTLSIKYIEEIKINISKTGNDLKQVLETFFKPATMVLIPFYYHSISISSKDDNTLKLIKGFNHNRTLTQNIVTIKEITNIDLSTFFNKRYLEISTDLDRFIPYIGNLSLVELMDFDYQDKVIELKITESELFINFIDDAIFIQICNYETHPE